MLGRGEGRQLSAARPSRDRGRLHGLNRRQWRHHLARLRRSRAGHHKQLVFVGHQQLDAARLSRGRSRGRELGRR